MRRVLFTIAVLAGVTAVLAQVQSRSQAPQPATSAEQPADAKNKAQAAKDHKADDAAIRANVDEFMKAFNARDAKGVAALFTTDGQIVDKDGYETEGREAILHAFDASFKAAPGKRIEVNVESIRFIGADLAMEVGTTKETFGPDEPPEYDRYTVLHVKRDGKWLMAMARDEEGPVSSGHDQLRPLAWLVGDWIDDGGSSVVLSSCHWSEDRSFLLQEFKLKVDGRDVMNVSQRIGWDPLAKCIRSWVFDSEGGFGESVWAREGDNWIIKLTAVRPDGTIGSATNTLVPAGTDAYVWRSKDRILAGEAQPSTEVKVIRKPPQPK